MLADRGRIAPFSLLDCCRDYGKGGRDNEEDATFAFASSQVIEGDAGSVRAVRAEHLVAPEGPRRVRVGERFAVTGPLPLLFRLSYGPRVLRAPPQTYGALEARAAAVRAGAC